MMVQEKRSNFNAYNLASTVGLAFTIPWIMFKVIRGVYIKHTYRSLHGKVVVITGASSGLGEALAHEFYKAGCQVVLCARRRAELDRVRTDLLRMHPTTPTNLPLVVPLDLSDVDTLPLQAQRILGITGHVDILVNNGGVSNRGSVVDTKVEVDMHVMMVNYFGTVALTKALLPSMISRHTGHIVAVSSVQGQLALPHRSAYGASKHALQAFMDSLRAEVAADGIKVTVASPGYVRTHLSENALTGEGGRHGELDRNTERGYKAGYVAEKIVQAVASGKSEVIVAQLTASLGLWLRHLCPSACAYIMAKRAQSNV